MWFGLAALVRFMEKVLGATKLSVSGLSVRVQVTSLCKFGHVTLRGNKTRVLHRADTLFGGDAVAKMEKGLGAYLTERINDMGFLKSIHPQTRQLNFTFPCHIIELGLWVN